MKKRILLTGTCIITCLSMYCNSAIGSSAAESGQGGPRKVEILDENAALIHRAEETGRSIRAVLNQNRVIWYTTFASAGTGFAISAMAKAQEGDLSYYVLPALVVGGIAGCAMQCCTNIGRFNDHPVLKYGGGLASIVPWGVFSFINISKN